MPSTASYLAFDTFMIKRFCDRGEVTSGRVAREVAHGRRLAESDPEAVWGWSTPAGRLRAERRAKLVLDAACVGPKTHVLEIGCGSGVFTEKFAAAGSTMVAVEVSPDLITLAKGRGLDPTRVQFRQVRFEDLDADDTFDAVIGSSVLHHLELDEALPKILTVLKPGGRMAFAEPNMRNPQIFVERKFRRFFPSVSPDETAFRRGRVSADLRALGFEAVVVTPFDWLHPATPERLIPAVRGMGRLLESAWPLSAFAGSLLITARKPR